MASPHSRNTTPGEAFAEAQRLAIDIVEHAKDGLLIDFKFLNRPMAQLPVRTTMGRRGCATDGACAFFSPGFVLDAFDGERTVIARAYLHMVLHCLLGHPFPRAHVDMLRWTVACDLAVGTIMAQMDGPSIALDDPLRDEVIATYCSRVDCPTAAAFYTLLQADGLDESALADVEVAIGMDGHELWLPQGNSAKSSPASVKADHVGNAPNDSKAEGTGTVGSGDKTDSASHVFDPDGLKRHWEDVAREVDMDAAHSNDGTAPAVLQQTIHNVVADQPIGLEEFVDLYAAPVETIATNAEDFDYVYYSYGLEQLENVALVEPLEYVEEPTTRDFFVAIDTSGSVCGTLVEAFLRKVCGLLLEDGLLGQKSCIRIIQCDCEIQDETTIRTADEARAYAERITLKGFGKTDFRPVFDRIAQLVESGESHDVACLLYFTDGKGIFPEEPPNYDTAFVFVDEVRKVPAWATAALVPSEDLCADNPLRRFQTSESKEQIPYEAS